MAKFNLKRLAGALTGKALPAAAGGAAGLAINKVIPASINPKLRGILKISAGAVLPELMPKMKAMEFVGAGFAGQAGAELAAELIPAIAGTDDQIEGVGSQHEFVTDADFVEGVEEDDIDGVGANNDPQMSGNEDPIVGDVDGYEEYED